MSTDQRSIQWYDEHAQEYTDHVRNGELSIFHSLYEKPAMYGLLPDLNNKTVISLGCGSGEDCNYLSQQGAKEVTGIDISSKMVEIARHTYTAFHFKVMDMENLEFEDASFDFAYSSLAIHYIEDWSRVFSEVFRVLKPGSYFLFSCGHPVYSAMDIIEDNENIKVEQLSRTRDKTENSVEITGNYLDRKPIVIKEGLAVTTWHKPIGEISSEAAKAGFMIAEICEPKPLSKMQELSPKDYTMLTKIPNFIIFKLWKPLS